MPASIPIIILFLLNYECVNSVRLLELRAPTHVQEGGEAILGCQYDMEGDVLYSVKWYKDGREFYRYVPKNKPAISHFATTGVIVDVARSSSNVVTLVHLTKESAGTYRCEVSGERPLFTTVYDSREISVYFIPQGGPRITGLENEYRVGDRLQVNCTSLPSRPETQLKWLLNDQPMSRKHLYGPWYRVSAERPDLTETILQLKYTIKHSHSKQGPMKLECQATIAPLYQEGTIHKATASSQPFSATPEADAENDIKQHLSQVFQEISHTTHLELPLAGSATTEQPTEDNDPDGAAFIRPNKSLVLYISTLINIAVLIELNQ